jgi:hypothetical protein
MNEDLESRLRAALRPVAPRLDFTEDLIARLSADQPCETTAHGFGRRTRAAPAWWLSASLAASLLIGAGIYNHLHQQHERAGGLEARRQVIEALRVTSQKLDLAYETVKSQSSSLSDGPPGV